jgi:membrane protein implicated in regulation of membrane protease activity
MKTIRIGFWLVVALVLVAVGLSNREIVTLHLMPAALAGAVGMRSHIDLPLFLVIFAGVASGLFVGFVWEWLREWNERALSRAKDAEIGRLTRELSRLNAEKAVGKDEVLALVERTGTRG